MDYVRGLQTLKNALPADKMDEFYSFEAQLLENLHRERLYGSTETIRSERMAVISGLNQLALTSRGISFNDLCFGSQTTKVNVSVTQPISSSESTIENEGTLKEAPQQIKVTPPRISVELLTKKIPTAYYYHLNVDEFPLVTVTVDNSGPNCDDIGLHINALIEDYSDVAEKSIDVAKGESTSISLLPGLKPAAIDTLYEIRSATLRTTVEQTAPTKRILAGSGTGTVRIHLLARNTALLAVEASDGQIEDLTKYLAAWITPHHPQIEKLSRQVIERHPDRSLAGYQGATTLDESTIQAREIAQAIFYTLQQETGLVYEDSPLSFGAAPDQFMQRVRLPSEILASGGLANCLDGTVLFASLLENASIQPVIMLIPGHAFVGWHVYKGVERYEFIETTMISSADFVSAQAVAQASFDDAQFRGYFSRELLHPLGYARMIDVNACRSEEIYPLE